MLRIPLYIQTIGAPHIIMVTNQDDDDIEWKTQSRLMYVKRCDKNVDCHDKSDEQNCNYRQPHDEVKSHQKDKYKYKYNW